MTSLSELRGIVAGAAVLLTIMVSGGSVGARQAASSSGFRDYPTADRSVWAAEQEAMRRKAAATRRPDAENVADVIAFLAEQRRGLEAVSLAREASRVQAARTGEIVSALIRVGSDIPFYDKDNGQLREALTAVLGDIGARLNAIPREQAARAARAILDIRWSLGRAELAGNPESYRDGLANRLQGFVRDFSGTAEAQLAEVDLIVLNPDEAACAVALERYVADHPGTVAAASALFKLAEVTQDLDEPGNNDPTQRFMKVLRIAGELESGRFPASEWVERAPSLVTGFYVHQAVYSPENLDRMIGAYKQFLLTHLVDDEGGRLGEYVNTAKAVLENGGGLFRLKGVPYDVEPLLDELEHAAKDPDSVRYLRAVLARDAGRFDATDAGRIESGMRSNRALADLSLQGREPWRQHALSTLAAELFKQRSYASAIEAHRRYVREYPQSEWAWVAALRVAQAQAELGWHGEARESLTAAAATYASRPVARIAALTLAAELGAAIGDFEGELAGLKHVLEVWEPAYGPSLSFATETIEPKVLPPEVLKTSFRRDDLVARVAALQSSLAQAHGREFEAGRWRFEQGDWDAAISMLEGMPQDAAPSLLQAARALARRARVERALAMADTSGPKPDESRADLELQFVAADPSDLSAAAAQLARAILAWKAGKQTEARAEMRAGLELWRTRQPLASSPVKGSVEDDVLAIRDLVFLPLGGALYDSGRGHWSAADFPSAMPPFLLARSTVPVKLSDDRSLDVAVNRLPGGLPNVLFFDQDQQALLVTLMNRLGGTATRVPESVMEVPNQPVGASLNILALFKEFFPARPGHWGGWEFYAFPLLSSMEFQDAARTQAVAAVTVGYAGADALLEKRDGVWTLIRLTRFWIT